jgi:hypothetical protein
MKIIWAKYNGLRYEDKPFVWVNFFIFIENSTSPPLNKELWVSNSFDFA